MITPVSKPLMGGGINKHTEPILLNYKDHVGMLSAFSVEIGLQNFHDFPGWTRILGGPSLAVIEDKLIDAKTNNLHYEAVTYDLERWEQTPQWEQDHPIEAGKQARDLIHSYGKTFIFGPGTGYMLRHEEFYPGMADLADMWMFQMQGWQKTYPPGKDFLGEATRVKYLVRSGNPDIPFWVQLTFTPNKPANAKEWLSYRNCLGNSVTGTYLGVYIPFDIKVETEYTKVWRSVYG